MLRRDIRTHAPLFAEVLATLWQDRRTGMLHVTASGKLTVVYFRKGRPVFAEGGAPTDLLGRMLLDSGRITEAELSRAVALLTNRLVDSELRLGDVLVELGFLLPSELFQALSMQLQRKLLACFGHRQLRLELKEGEEHLEGVTDLAVEVPILLKDGVSQMHRADVDRFLGRIDHQYPTCSMEQRTIEQSFALGGRERRLLDRIDARTTVRQLRDAAAAGTAERTGQLLMALVLGRALSLSSWPAVSVEPEPEQPPRTTFYGSARKVAGDDLDDTREGRLRSLVDGLRRVRRRG